MSDRVLVILANGSALALTADQYRDALTAGAELTGAPAPSPAATDEPLLDADTAAERLGLTARWLEDMARAGVVPHHKFGRFIRFNVREIAAHFRVDGAPATDSESVTPFRRVRGQ